METGSSALVLSGSVPSQNMETDSPALVPSALPATPNKKLVIGVMPRIIKLLVNWRDTPDKAKRDQMKEEIKKEMSIIQNMNTQNGHLNLQTDVIPVDVLGEYYDHAYDILADYAKTENRQYANHAARLQQVSDETKQTSKASRCGKGAVWPYDPKHEDGLGGRAYLCPEIDLEKSRAIGDEYAALAIIGQEVQRILGCNEHDYRAILGYPPGPVEIDPMKIREFKNKIHPDRINQLFNALMSKYPERDLEDEKKGADAKATQALQWVNQACDCLMEESAQQRPAFEQTENGFEQRDPNISGQEHATDTFGGSGYKGYVEYHSQVGKDFRGRDVLAQMRNGTKGLSYVIDMGECEPGDQRWQILPSSEVGSKITRVDCMNVPFVGAVDQFILDEMAKAIENKDTSKIYRIVKITGVARKARDRIAIDAKNTPTTVFRIEWNREINNLGKVHFHVFTFLTRFSGPETAAQIAVECEKYFGIPNPKQGLLGVAERLLLPGADSEVYSEASTALVSMSQQRKKPKARWNTGPQKELVPWNRSQPGPSINPASIQVMANDENLTQRMANEIAKTISAVLSQMTISQPDSSFDTSSTFDTRRSISSNEKLPTGTTVTGTGGTMGSSHGLFGPPMSATGANMSSNYGLFGPSRTNAQTPVATRNNGSGLGLSGSSPKNAETTGAGGNMSSNQGGLFGSSSNNIGTAGNSKGLFGPSSNNLGTSSTARNANSIATRNNSSGVGLFGSSPKNAETTGAAGNMSSNQGGLFGSSSNNIGTAGNSKGLFGPSSNNLGTSSTARNANPIATRNNNSGVGLFGSLPKNVGASGAGGNMSSNQGGLFGSSSNNVGTAGNSGGLFGPPLTGGNMDPNKRVGNYKNPTEEWEEEEL